METLMGIFFISHYISIINHIIYIFYISDQEIFSIKGHYIV